MKIIIFNKNKNKLLSLSRIVKEMLFNPILTSDEEELFNELKNDDNDIILVDVASISINIEEFTEKIVKNKKNAYIMSIVSDEDLYFRIQAIELGFDDYMYNDFKASEFTSKIKAIMRILTIKSNDNNSEILSIFDLKLNPLNRTVERRDKQIELTSKEFQILEYLLRNKDSIITKDMILEKIWSKDLDKGRNSIHVFINFIRKKVDDGFEQKVIKTIRGVGYIVKEY